MVIRILAGMLFGTVLIFLSACSGGGANNNVFGGGPAQPPGNSNALGSPDTLPPALPAGLVAIPATFTITPTSLSFSSDGSTLYVASLTGFVLAYPITAGQLAAPPIPFLSGLSMPLGVLATPDAVYVSVVQDGAGAVLRARDSNGDLQADLVETVISGLPIGRHNTNGLALGPDGFLYVVNGNSTDTGFRDEGGPPESPPFSGSLLRIDPAATGLSPSPGMVVATGWRNPFDLAFVPAGHPSLPAGLAAVTNNGPDGESYTQPDGSSIDRPDAEDSLSLFSVTDSIIEHFGFPWCLYDRDNNGLAGFPQDVSEGSCAPLTPQAFTGLAGTSTQAFPSTLFGKHVSANGLAFNPGGNFPDAFTGDLFVAEFGNNPGETFVGHKVVRVHFAADGNIESVQDFIGGLAPLDLTFAPDGSLWIADFSGLILRVSAPSN